MKRVIVSFSLLQIEESGEPIPKPFVVSKIKFANPLYALGEVANFNPGKYATSPLAKTALANFNILNLLSLNPSSPFCHQRGREKGLTPPHIIIPLSGELSAIPGMCEPPRLQAVSRTPTIPSRAIPRSISSPRTMEVSSNERA